MQRLQYIGQSHFRQISAADFRGIGIPSQGDISLAREDIDPAQNLQNLSSVAEVTPEAAAELLKREPNEWLALEEGQSPVVDPRPDELKVAADGTLGDEVETIDAGSTGNALGVASTPDAGGEAAEKPAGKTPRARG